jgi:hypothetical protein
MPAISHVKSNTVADWGAGAVTVFNSVGSTTTVNATDLVRPVDWNSVHNQTWTISSNTSGDASTHSGTNLVFGGQGAMTLNMSTAAGAATLWISAPNDAPMSEYEPIQGTAVLTNSTLGHLSIYMVPFYVDDEVYVSRVNFFASVATSMANANNTGSGGITLSAALYSRHPSSADRITRLWSMSYPLKATKNSNTQLEMTNPIGIAASDAVSTSLVGITDGNASTYMRDLVAGYRVWAMPMNSTLAPGRYWMAVGNSLTNQDTNCGINASIGQQTIATANNIAYQRVGTSSSASNLSYNVGMYNGGGTYSAVSAAFPASIPITSDSIRVGASFVFPYFNFSGLDTASSIL